MYIHNTLKFAHLPNSKANNNDLKRIQYLKIQCTVGKPCFLGIGSMFTNPAILPDQEVGSDCLGGPVYCSYKSMLSQGVYCLVYYATVNEARPISGFSPTDAVFFILQKCISNHATKTSSTFQSDPISYCFTIDVWKIKYCTQQFIFLLSYCSFFFVSHFTQVLECCDTWYLGNRVVIGAIFIEDNNLLFKREDGNITQNSFYTTGHVNLHLHIV